MRAVDQAGVLVDGDLAHDGIRHDGEIARRHRVRQQQVERAGEMAVAEGAADLGDGHPERLARFAPSAWMPGCRATCPR